MVLPCIGNALSCSTTEIRANAVRPAVSITGNEKTLMSSSTAEPQRKFNKGRLAAFAFGNFGQSLLYNALSTYFMVFATNALFAGVDKTTAADMTQANITTFEGFAFWMPLAFIIIGFLIFAFFVKIDEKAHAHIVAKIEANLHDESDAAKYGKDIAKAALLGKESAAR